MSLIRSVRRWGIPVRVVSALVACAVAPAAAQAHPPDPVDDSACLGAGALEPDALVAQEFDTAPGLGQADAGRGAGTYLEFGVAPGWAGEAVGLAFPPKVGLSAGDYYERAGADHTCRIGLSY